MDKCCETCVHFEAISFTSGRGECKAPIPLPQWITGRLYELVDSAIVRREGGRDCEVHVEKAEEAKANKGH